MRRMLMMSAFLALTTLNARAESACQVTEKQALEIAATFHEEHGALVTLYDGDDARRLVASINAEPPESVYVAERVIVIAQPFFAKFALVRDGCVNVALIPTPAQFTSVMNRLASMPLDPTL